jgi:hypothetical protein
MHSNPCLACLSLRFPEVYQILKEIKTIITLTMRFPEVNQILKQIKTIIIPLTMQPAVKLHSLLEHRTAMGEVNNQSTKTHILYLYHQSTSTTR